MKRFFLLILFSVGVFAQSSNLIFDGKNYYYADRILVKFKTEVSYDFNKKAFVSDDFNKKLKS